MYTALWQLADARVAGQLLVSRHTMVQTEHSYGSAPTWKAPRFARQTEQFLQGDTVLGPATQPVPVHPVNPVTVTPGHGISCESAVSYNYCVMGAVGRPGGAIYLVHHGRSDLAADPGVLGLYHDPAVLPMSTDDVRGLIATLSHPLGQPAIADQQIS